VRILIVNPPHPAIGSRIPCEQLPPLGLLSIGGPLLDAGHNVTLLDAEIGCLPQDEIVRKVATHQPQILLIGHSGSTSAHPIVAELTRRFRENIPNLNILYGGVFPTYHYRDILAQESQIDVVIRGEGEVTVPKLVAAIEYGGNLNKVAGIAFRHNEEIIETLPAPMIQDLDACRVGWELIDLKRYGYYGGKQAVVIVRYSAPLDWVLPHCFTTTRDSTGSAEMGLQTSGFRDTTHAPLANFSVGEIHRDFVIGPSQSIMAFLSTTRLLSAAWDVLVYADGSACFGA
jgi:hypothetical protein